MTHKSLSSHKLPQPAALLHVCASVLQVLLFLQEEEEESSPETQVKTGGESGPGPSGGPLSLHVPPRPPLTLRPCCWGSCSLPGVGWASGQQDVFYWFLLVWSGRPAVPLGPLPGDQLPQQSSCIYGHKLNWNWINRPAGGPCDLTQAEAGR